MILVPALAALAGLLIGLRSRVLVVRYAVPGGERPGPEPGPDSGPESGTEPGAESEVGSGAEPGREPEPAHRSGPGGTSRGVRPGPPPLAVEALTAAALGALALRAVAGGPLPDLSAAAVVAWSAELLALCWLAAVCVLLAFVDAAVHRLPDRFTLAAYLGTAVPLTAAAAAGGRSDDLLRAGLGGLALAVFYLVLFLVNPAGMGLGDVKLAASLGTALGWFGWDVLVAGAFLGFLAGGLYGGALLLARRANRRSEIPFGPFMIIGTFAVLLAGPAP
ncbi:prepilin peptidase [Planomonospora sp. ID82291]|uniref:prepilin peptidase n=1 Tax=Planomonospora sp. ID82291 TaxID=2738136 RepID=UPI0018C35F21|nr:prepilin peptidase [Planomonospora sp. ID82291]MBG0817310.1 prepilin peptidase [Planomonospora sp. ID82291]